jgi:protein tyrosine/serine phosphatase
MAIGSLGKQARRVVKRVTMAWRQRLVDDTPAWLRRIAGGPASYLDMLLLDHGIFRVIYGNRHRLDANAFRAAQPAPHQIRAAARMGIRTIVNLRGERMCGSYWLEEAACRRYGIKLVNYQVRSRAAPSLEELRGARDLFEQVEYPILMHCKSGADRAGLMSVLYQHLRGGVPMEQAIKQLSLRYGHIRQADTGVLDAFFERYLSDTQERPMPFFEWVETIYDPDELKRTFQANGMANRLVNSVLRRE